MRVIEVRDYDPAWPAVFEALRGRIWRAVAAHALRVEHVGSTAVPGLPAKPIIDMDVVIPSREALPAVIAGLAALGHVHGGDRGIAGREAFMSPDGLPAHHLYVCAEGSLALANHLAVREHLRGDAEARRRYGEIKRALAAQHPTDIDRYVAAKTDFLLQVLAAAGMTPASLQQIGRENDRAARLPTPG